MHVAKAISSIFYTTYMHTGVAGRALGARTVWNQVVGTSQRDRGHAKSAGHVQWGLGGMGCR